MREEGVGLLLSYEQIVIGGKSRSENCALRLKRVIDGVSLELKPTDVIRNVSLGSGGAVDL
jgi:hypothetical protein